MRNIKLFIFILCAVSMFNCYRSTTVQGPEYVMYVFAEDVDYVFLEETLTSVFEREIMTPQPEIHFKLVRVKAEEFNEYLTYKQLLFVASLQSEGPIADIVKRSVDQSEIREKVENSENFLFKRENQWIKNQMILTLVAPTKEELKKKITENSNFIYNYFYDFQQKTVQNFIYRELENKDIPNELLEKYQWRFRIPHDYFIDKEDQENNFVFLRRRIPERWIFVKWFENVDPNLITPEWFYDLRDSLEAKYYDGNMINRKYTKAKESEFLGRWCLKVEGLWEHVEQAAGGPFFAYSFYDEGTQRVYVIDCATFAPNKVKIPYLDQMNAVALTFKTKVELQRIGAE